MTTSPTPTQKPIIGMIWAQTLDGAIGVDGDLPWHIPEDLKHFKEKTYGHPVVMGRITWDSLPKQVQPLPGRQNIVISRNQELIQELNDSGAADQSLIAVDSLEKAMELARRAPGSEEIWIIGGGIFFEKSLQDANVLEITYVRGGDFEGDTFAPAMGPEWQLSNSRPNAPREAENGWFTSSSGLEYRIERWEK